MNVNGYSSISLKPESIKHLRELAIKEENSLSKQLRIICKFYKENCKEEILV